jgi:hypothetical protein
VLDVQPKLGARVRLLPTGNISKNDPDDARSVAVAALRSATCREVRADDHAAAGSARRSASLFPAMSPRRSPQLRP